MFVQRFLGVGGGGGRVGGGYQKSGVFYSAVSKSVTIYFDVQCW